MSLTHLDFTCSLLVIEGRASVEKRLQTLWEPPQVICIMLQILCLEVATLQRLCWLIVIVVVVIPAVLVPVTVGQ